MQAEWSPRSLSYGLAGGNSGLAVLYDAIARALHDPRFASQRDIRWNAAVDQVAEVDSHPSLYAGYSGLGWATAMLGDGVSENEDTVHEELEEAMLACLDEPPQTYDLVSGPVGWALYSLERWPRPRAQRALRRILEHLGRSAERVSDGFRWWTP
ncbi:MAG TPA: lanthionine synthetase LanC family protein, partial [Candidatus Eisenbacteria bacterium]|nr:lanthionine synthetase LanC family protein [Candidatus Eisenbacteria bacterium]